MRYLLLSISFLFLAASFFPIVAQEVDEAAAIRQKAIAKVMPYSMGSTGRIFANGLTLHSIFLNNGDEEDFQQFVGTTDNQYQEFSDYMIAAKEVSRKQLLPLITRIAEETDEKKIPELAREWQASTYELIKKHEAKAAEILNPGQIRKFREFELHTNQQMQQIGLPFFNYECYSVLELSPEQKKQIEGIRDGFREEQQSLADEIAAVFVKPGSKPDEETLKKRAEKEKEITERGKQLHVKMKTEVHGLLTREQLSKLGDLLKETPECYTNMLKRRRMPPPKVDEKKYSDWQKSWKPGDPIPAEYRRREKARRSFP